MSIASGIVGAIMSAQAQEDASEKNAQNVRQTNKQNYQMFQESRGSGGSAVMPLYLRTKSGDLFEKKLGQDLVDAYDSTARPKSDFAAVGDRFGTMSDQAQHTAQGIFDGGVQREMEANAAPVQKARVSFRRQSAMNTLNKTLGEIGAMQAGRGYSSDSFGDRMLKFQANTGAADEVSAANLQNLDENRQIADAALQLRLSNLNLPNEETQRAMQLLTMPDEAYLSDQQMRMQPLTFLRIGGAQPFQNQNLPTVQPIPSALQLAAQGTAAAGNMALNYWLQKQTAKNYAGAMNSTNGGGGGYGGGDYGGYGGGTAGTIAAAPSYTEGLGDYGSMMEY
jgi:hypothetical protein